MKIEIWSDVVCPFCYIGKRVFEKSLAQLDFAIDIEVVWKSFQLDPNTPDHVDSTYLDYLCHKKGISKAQANEMLSFVTARAKEEGLDYQLEKAIITNSFKAQLLIQLAKQHGKGNDMEELLFQAFFTESKNISDVATLIQLGKEVGLGEEQILVALASDELAYEIKSDIDEARHIGVTGVPFFVLDRKYAISGAQPVEAFTQTIKKVYEEWNNGQQVKLNNISQGESCSTDGKCTS